MYLRGNLARAGMWNKSKNISHSNEHEEWQLTKAVMNEVAVKCGCETSQRQAKEKSKHFSNKKHLAQ